LLQGLVREPLPLIVEREIERLGQQRDRLVGVMLV
jgi:hypothetical protein